MSFLSSLFGHKTNNQNVEQELVRLKSENQALQEKYRLLTDNLAAAVVIRDKSGKISYCSPYTEVITGWAVSEMYSSQEDFFL